MDDGTFGGNCEDVVKDLLMKVEEAGTLGLELNHRKTELICLNPNTRGIALSVFPCLRIVNMEDGSLLVSLHGAPICVDKCMNEKVNDLKLMGDRIKHLHFQDAL